MCGIFGAIGQRFNVGTIRALALINRERGTDSLGFFDSSGRMVKSACDPLEALCDVELSQFLNRAAGKSWFVAGHTRHATRGNVTRKNAHPFRYGHIIGAHNGMVDAPKRYAVDSQYIFDRLREFPSYQDALAPIAGYWGLSWFDGQDFYLSAFDNSIYAAKSQGAWYYSSDSEHLAACLGVRKLVKIANGATLKFSRGAGDFQRLPDFVSTAEKWGASWKSATSGKAKGKSGKAKASEASRYAGDWLSDSEWQFAEDMAQECGYPDFYSFMETEDVRSESRAYDMLFDAYSSATADRAAKWEGDELLF